MKLSEILKCSHLPEPFVELQRQSVARAVALEAEVERLREKEVVYTRDIMPMIDELSLHQAAVAEIRAIYDRIPDPSIDFDASVMDVLDMLPGAKSIVDG